MTPATQQRLAELQKARGIAHKQIVSILRHANPAADEDMPEIHDAEAEYHRQLAVERYQDTSRQLLARRRVLTNDNPIQKRKAS